MSAAAAIADERAREAATAVATRWHYARFAIPDRFDDGGFVRWLDELLAWLRNLHDYSPPLYYLLTIGLLLGSLALLAHVLWSIRSALRANELAAPARRAAPPRRLDAEAESLAGEGRFLEAAHAMHLACVAQLVEGGVIALQRHEPNPTLRAQLRRAALREGERTEFLALLGRLEQRWFRDPAPDPRDAELFAAWRGLHARLARPA